MPPDLDSSYLRIDEGNEMFRSESTVRSGTYHRHHFLIFSGGNSTWGVHDPDCTNPKHKRDSSLRE